MSSRRLDPLGGHVVPPGVVGIGQQGVDDGVPAVAAVRPLVLRQLVAERQLQQVVHDDVVVGRGSGVGGGAVVPADEGALALRDPRVGHLDPEQRRHQLRRGPHGLVVEDLLRGVEGERRGLVQPVPDLLAAPAVGVLRAHRVGVLPPDHRLVGRDEVPAGRVVGVGQLREGDASGPVVALVPARRRGAPVAAAAHGQRRRAAGSRCCRRCRRRRGSATAPTAARAPRRNWAKSRRLVEGQQGVHASGPASSATQLERRRRSPSPPDWPRCAPSPLQLGASTSESSGPCRDERIRSARGCSSPRDPDLLGAHAPAARRRRRRRTVSPCTCSR